MSKYGGVVEVLHVASSDEADLVLDDGTIRAISLDLVFPGAFDDAHSRDMSHEKPSALGGERGEFLVCGKEPMFFVRAFHGNFVGVRLGNGEGGGKMRGIGKYRDGIGGGLGSGSFTTRARVGQLTKEESILRGLKAGNVSRAGGFLRRDNGFIVKVGVVSERVRLNKLPRIIGRGGKGRRR